MKAPAAIPGKVLLSAVALAAAAGLAPRLPFGLGSGTTDAGETTGRPVPEPGPARGGALGTGEGRSPCGPAAGPCRDENDVLAGVGLEGLDLTPTTAPPRTEPVPLAAGSRELARYRTGGMTLFLDRPADPDLALELAALEFHRSGWRPAWGPGEGRREPRAPAGEVYVRGDEVAVATLSSTVAGEPLLLVAYQGPADPREEAP